MGWKTQILGSIGSAVAALDMDLFVANVGKRRITFPVTEFVHALLGVFKHLQLHYLTCFLFELSLGHHPKRAVKYIPSFKVQPLSGKGWKSMSALKIRRKILFFSLP